MVLSIIIDTREQTPWHFPEWLATATRGTLSTGDYALVGDDGFAIERKSLADFVGTIATGWGRFLREIDRMDGWPAKVIIVEGSFSDLVFTQSDGIVHPPNHEHWRISSNFATKRLAQLTMRGVSVLFAENAGYATAVALAVFKERAESIELDAGNES